MKTFKCKRQLNTKNFFEKIQHNIHKIKNLLIILNIPLTTKIWNGLDFKILTKQMYKKLQKEISNSNPRNPLIHHWKHFYYLVQNSISKYPKSKTQKSKYSQLEIQIFIISKSKIEFQNFNITQRCVKLKKYYSLPKLSYNIFFL